MGACFKSDSQVIVLSFLAGMRGAKLSINPDRRSYQENCIVRLMIKLFNSSFFFFLFCCHFNSMSQGDWDGRDQSGRWSLWPSVQSHHPVKYCLNHAVIVLSLQVFKGFKVQKMPLEAPRFYTNITNKDWKYCSNLKLNFTKYGKFQIWGIKNS